MSKVPVSRRHLLMAAALLPAVPAAAKSPPSLADILSAGMMRHAPAIVHQDVAGVVDFALPSRQPRFWLVDRVAGRASVHLVSHGRGSDPQHSGWLQSFSNLPGSNASSDGAYLTGDHYQGRHGRSQRLIGLDDSNSNAEARAIVIHGAWYVSEQMVRTHGKLGRSEGCFAFSGTSLDEVLQRLGPGRLILAGRFGLQA